MDFSQVVRVRLHEALAASQKGRPMPRFSLHVDDDQNSPPRIRAIFTGYGARAKGWTRQMMGVSPQVGGFDTRKAGERQGAVAEVSASRKTRARVWIDALVDICDFLLFLPLIPLIGLRRRERPEPKAIEPEHLAANTPPRRTKD